MNDRIVQTLKKLFDNHRIVFWYDDKKELRSDFESLQLPEVEKQEIINNEFGLKFRVLREAPNQKFLLYHEGEKPEDINNWLLDVLLAHGEFRTNQVAINLIDLGLGIEFADLLSEHQEFFLSTKRKSALAKLLQADDTAMQIRLKMLAVCVGGEARIDSIMEHLLKELAENREEQFNLLSRCGLEGFFWEQLLRIYDYHSDVKSIADLHLRIFSDCYEMELEPVLYAQARKKSMGAEAKPSRMSEEILFFLGRIKDSRQLEKAFQCLSDRYAEEMRMAEKLAAKDFRDLLKLDLFRLVDRKIISDLVREVLSRTVAYEDVKNWIRQRRGSHFFYEFCDLYEALDYASLFFHLLTSMNFDIENFDSGITLYAKNWYRVDQAYRKFMCFATRAEQASLMSELIQQVENYYSNRYLLKLGDAFQAHVESNRKWGSTEVVPQSCFYTTWVLPLLQRNIKVCVIVSDALRYEIAAELLDLIGSQNRYTAELKPALSMLPSYTQLGMAALLPHQSLAIQQNDSATVLLNNQSSQGITNRIKILSQLADYKATALKSGQLMDMKLEECRALIRDHNLVYIYHNQIDARGDKRDTEGTVFDAVEDTLQDMLRMVKKLTGANASHILITADHGFIYQNRPIAESDFSSAVIQGEDIWYQDRRFVIGRGLTKQNGLHTFQASELGLDGDYQIQIPKSINRLRLQGSGSRFVHGGASLQEVVIPVLKIHKARQSDTSFVEVQILPGTSSVITAGQISVTFYQSQPVTHKIHSRNLRAGIYTQAGDLISESHDLTFDRTSESPREREQTVRFLLSREADSSNGKEVILKLEEKLSGTAQYKEYSSQRYLLRRSFVSDFDI